jgi:ribosomal protein S18 acetylase RimI-like enzyme
LGAAMIKPLTLESLPTIAEVVRESFRAAAIELNLTPQNCPTHNYFLTNERLAEKFTQKFFPYGYFLEEKLIGFVALVDKGENIFEMNMLCVLPKFRHKKIGKELVDFCKEKVAELGGKKIEIGLWENGTVLQKWYAAFGFVFTETKIFAHMPFPVGYMEWKNED